MITYKAYDEGEGANTKCSEIEKMRHCKTGVNDSDSHLDALSDLAPGRKTQAG